MADHPLPLTGERTVPGLDHENYWFARHVAAYAFAARRAGGLRVLDAGCGEGYGARMLDDVAAHVVGVDLVGDVVAHARGAYPGVEFLEADLCDLPLPDACVDLVVSLQVIEHLPDIPRFVAEMARVLRPGGELVCATPNRLTFTPGSDTPVNPFHTVEFTASELRDTLAGPFAVQDILGLRHGRRLRAVEGLARRSLPDLVLGAPPQEWPRWLAALVARVRPGDFRLRADDLDTSLDLVALARRP
ncbi:MAG TPA: class I SAM-dependent methyltransferase [Egibacteraceae bacterium]|nr:class I SAM-dependent methyltransferase [Egibacteraceae bacterium]